MFKKKTSIPKNNKKMIMWGCPNHGFSNRRCCIEAVMMNELKKIMKSKKQITPKPL